jgi:hypothetical protein
MIEYVKALQNGTTIYIPKAKIEMYFRDGNILMCVFETLQCSIGKIEQGYNETPDDAISRIVKEKTLVL